MSARSARFRRRVSRPAGHSVLARVAPTFRRYLSAIGLSLGLTALPLFAEEAPATGQQLYQQKCGKCHGPLGEGTAAYYPDPLTGDRSLAELSQFIATSMPPDRKERLAERDAKLVAEYVFQAFYSQQGSAPPTPRVALQHLTVRRYRNAIADLMTSFRGGTGIWDDQRGLKASYGGTSPKGGGTSITRVDPVIQFDFGKGSPIPEKIDPREFSIIFEGSLRAPVTGEYEFIVRSENSIRLFVNDRVQPLVDAWVKSGDDKEFRGVVRLLGGRGYPVLLQFTKSGQGVSKADEQKLKDPILPASISLSWIPPGRSEEIVPAEFLSPNHFPETYFVDTPFPPDDRSTGFERGTSVSREWEQATTNAALEIADYVVLRLRDLTGGAEPGPEYDRRLREFSRQFVERAFRRPLDDEQRALYVDRPFEGEADAEVAVQKVVLLALKSPRFLYPGIGDTPGDPFGAATRFAFALWDGPPDAPLLAAAAEGRLTKREELAAHAERMSRDPRFRFKLREFLLQWMKLDQVRELHKSAEQFPGFGAQTARDLRVSLELFLENVLASDECDYRRLFLADTLYLNGRLSKIYGGDLPAEAPFRPVAIDGSRRAGIVTHPYLMAVFADATTSSPIRRGVFVARSVLGRALLPPEDAFVPLPPSLHPGLSTRERVQLQTKDAACQTCHALINPLGFPLEQFDALGRYRADDGGRPVDATGEYTSRQGAAVKFQGARDLAEYLAQSDEAHTAVIEKLFSFSVQQSVRAYGPDVVSQLKKSFADSGYNLRKLLTEMAVVSAIGTPASVATSSKAP